MPNYPLTHDEERLRVHVSGAYEQGYSDGVTYAERDMRDHGPLTDEIERLRDEARTDVPWLRAYYLGAARGYRSVVRTFARGRWGT